MNTKLLVILAGAAAIATGCRQPSPSAHDPSPGATAGHTVGALPPKDVDKQNLENIAKFVLLDKGAQESVACSGIQERILEDGRLEVVANVWNRLNRRIEVQVNCVFKDERGFPTLDDAPFQTLILTENAQEGVRFTSLNNLAKTYTIRIRQAR